MKTALNDRANDRAYAIAPETEHSDSLSPLRGVRLLIPIFLIIIFTAPVLASGSGPSAPHDVGPLLVSLVLIILAAKVGADISLRIGQPPVLGEIAVGLIVGNLAIVGFHGLDYIKTEVVVSALAEIGVILLLFEIGLQTEFRDIVKVGASALIVAALGIIAPFALGYAVARFFLPEHTVYAHIFIATVLCATSVGITARVFKDMGKLHIIESRIILGAAVIDDVLGLLVLAIVQGIVTAASGAGTISAAGMALVVIKAIGFLFLAIILGQLLTPHVFRFASRLKASDLLLAISLAICFLFAYLAHKVGLAPIVGAFAAGIVLEDVHYRDFTDRGEHGLEDLLAPITSFIVPIFFVLMGIRVELGAFGDWSTIAFAGALSLAAIVGKQICAVGAFGMGVDRFLVGLGMIPRGEVGLIVAAIGARLVLHGERIIDPRTFSAVVIVVMLTTLLTPPLLRWRMGGREVAGG